MNSEDQLPKQPEVDQSQSEVQPTIQTVEPTQLTQSAYQVPVPQKSGNGLSIVGFILSFIIAPVGLIISIISIVKAKKAGTKSGLSLAGIIIGSIGTVIGAILICLMLLISTRIAEKCVGLGSGSHVIGGVTYKCGDNFNINTNNEAFDPGKTKDYTVVGYMDYTVPESWAYNEDKSANAQYNAYHFDYEDSKSILSVKATGVYDPSTLTFGISHDELIESIEETFGNSYTEETELINGVLWYHVVTNPYSFSQSAGADRFHDEFYFFISEEGSNFYKFQFTLSEDVTSSEKELRSESIEYILDSAVLQKTDE